MRAIFAGRSGALRAAARLHGGPVLVAVLIAGLYLALDLRGGDLAAHLFRAELFKSQGLLVWNYNWYGGHHTVSYGIMFPGLAATVGVRLAGTLTYIAAVLLFSVLAHKVWHRGAAGAAYVFAVSFSASLVIGQLPFALGIAFGLGALLASHRGLAVWAGVLTINCALASPLAALFVAFVAGVVWLDTRRLPDLVVALTALVPAFVLSFLFPEGGWQPFHFASFAVAAAATAFFWWAVRDELDHKMRGAVRGGVALYALFLLANLLVRSPVGGNAVRLGMLVCAPVAAAVLWPRSRRYSLAFIIPLLAWQMAPAFWAVYTEDRSTRPEYYAPVNAWLDQRDRERDDRVEVVFTRSHYEAAYIAAKRPIARGWERQLDTKYNSLFYEGQLTPRRYAAWLAENQVRWVAVPSVTYDYSARAEAELIAAGLPYLRQRAVLRDWRIYAVDLPRVRYVIDPRASRVDRGEFQIRPLSWGTTVTSVRWQRYWRPSYGCISTSDDGWLVIELPSRPEAPVDRLRPSWPVAIGAPAHSVPVMGPMLRNPDTGPPTITISTDITFARLFDSDRRCAEYDAQPDEPSSAESPPGESAPDDSPRGDAPA